MPIILEDDQLTKLDKVGLVRNGKGERLADPKIESSKIDLSKQSSEINQIKQYQESIASELRQTKKVAEFAARQVINLQQQEPQKPQSWEFNFSRNAKGLIESVKATSSEGSWEFNISRDSSNVISNLKATKYN